MPKEPPKIIAPPLPEARANHFHGVLEGLSHCTEGAGQHTTPVEAAHSFMYTTSHTERKTHKAVTCESALLHSRYTRSLAP